MSYSTISHALINYVECHFEDMSLERWQKVLDFRRYI